MQDVFVARQSILDRAQEIYAYELLYRSSSSNVYSAQDGDAASLDLISHSLHVIGLETLTGNKKAFVNFTQGLLDQDVATLLPKNRIVVEILETVVPTKRILTRCQRLKQLGYTLALDDFLYNRRFEPLLEVADIVKVDFLGTTRCQRESIVSAVQHRPIQLLAEKVETQEDFQEGIALGFEYFQGYFFSKPTVLKGRDIAGQEHIAIALLQEIHRPDLNWDQTEVLIMSDPTFSFKLLRFINSSAFARRCDIKSIRQAMVFLGERGIRQWISLIALRSISTGSPNELLVTATLRARFCQLLAIERNMDTTDEVFFVGLFSLLDVFLQKPIKDILDELPVQLLVKQTLLGEQTSLTGILTLVTLYEQAKWEDVRISLRNLGIQPDRVKQIYLEALEFANQFIR